MPRRHPRPVRRRLPPYQARPRIAAAPRPRRAPAQLLAGLLLLSFLVIGARQVLACDGQDDLARFVSETYGERIEFDVLRNGKPVGEHVTTFAVDERGLAVTSRMRMDLRLLFVPVYDFDYHSESRWCNGRLQALDVRVSDNGEPSSLAAEAAADALRIVGAAGTLEVAPDVLTTDHWNPRVLESDRVINTLTGRINEVQLRECATPSAVAALAPALADARCYDYTGDLTARVWYDSAGRWVGLHFKGRDGSDILYACRNCQAQSESA